MYLKKMKKKKPIFLVNPKIVLRSKKTSIYEEGCLSLPGHFAEIERPAECHVKYIDYYGKKKEIKATGLLSTCIQHEIDHLNGVVCMDRRIDMTIKRTEKKIGRNQLVTIKKGDAVQVLKYKKAQKFLNDGWVLSED